MAKARAKPPRRATSSSGPMPGQVRLWMTKTLVTVQQSTRVLAAWELMMRRRIRHLPVLDDARRLVGIVSERDLRRAILECSVPGPASRPARPLDTLCVDGVMTRGVLTAHPEIGVREAAEIMRVHGLGALPVARSGRVVGMVTATDLIRALTGRPRRSSRRRDLPPSRRGAGQP